MEDLPDSSLAVPWQVWSQDSKAFGLPKAFKSLFFDYGFTLCANSYPASSFPR
jgi:hypothetical protein